MTRSLRKNRSEEDGEVGRKKREEGEKGIEGGREISNEGRDSSTRTRNGSWEVGKIQDSTQI